MPSRTQPRSSWNQPLFWLLPLLAAAVFALNRPDSIDAPSISVPEAKALIDAGALVVDVRSEEAYRKRHLPGAVSAPVDVLRQGVPAAIAQAGDRPVVVYCNDGARSGPEGTLLLNRAGIARAVNVKTGIEGWAGAGLAVLP